MKVLRQRKYLFALLALLVVFAACKGESPTAPTPTGGSGGGGTSGGTTPPVGATITLTVSNASPLVNSTSVVTATVSANGNPVPNGTAVEFDTTLGTWTDTASTVTIRTTTNGVATATLTSPSAGTAKVTAIVNNVSKTTNIVFQAATTPPTNNPTAPTVTGVSPTSGLATGGETITITGTNFSAPVRVLFDFGGGVIKEGFVASVTPTLLTVVTPKVDLGAGQTAAATIIVINQAGTTSEARVTASAPFTFRVAQLTPSLTTVSPDSGPIGGGTRITIFGSGFEAPVQVAFSKTTAFAQMQVISVTFNQIIAITPTARDVNPDGSGVLVGPVDLRVININSNKSATLTAAFRYTPAMQITGLRPLQGTALGGTDVTIDGIGFDPPVDVFIGGVLAQTIRVSGTQILARTSPLAIPCANNSGPVKVVNINNGDTASSDASFTYIGVNPLILSVSGGPFIPGSTLTATVQDPGIGPLGNALLRFSIGGQNVTPAPNQITVGTGPQTFTMVIPATGFTFPTITCTTASATPGTQLGPINVDLVFTNLTTGCTNTLSNGVTINPPGPNPCLQPPTASTSAPACPIGVVISAVSATGTATGTGTFTISNAPNSRDLTLSVPVAAGVTNVTTVTVVPATAATVPGGTTAPSYTITVDPIAAGPFSGTVTFTTNDPTKTTLQVCFSGTATP
jgi:IPT/TIG domain